MPIGIRDLIGIVPPAANAAHQQQQFKQNHYRFTQREKIVLSLLGIFDLRLSTIPADS